MTMALPWPYTEHKNPSEFRMWIRSSRDYRMEVFDRLTVGKMWENLGHRPRLSYRDRLNEVQKYLQTR